MEVLRVLGGRGRLGRASVGRGGFGVCMHAGCSTAGLAGRAPAIAARGGGPGARGWHGEVQGDKSYVQDMVALRFAAGWDKVAWWMACPWHGSLG